MKFRAILTDKEELENREKFRLKDWHKNIIYFVVVAAVINILAVIYITKSNYIYFWDNSTYWDISREIASGSINDGGFWTNVYNSIATQDYNYIAGLPSALLVKMFGESRLVYILGLVNMYLLPSFVMIFLLARKVSKAPKIATTLAILICPAMTMLTFLGFVDIGGVLICLICFNLYYLKTDKKIGIWRYIVIGILLVLVMLWRRWYAFFSVSFITAMVADSLLFKRKWYHTAVTVLVAGLIVVIFFRDFLLEKLLADYGNLYSGYKFSIATDFKLVTRYFGLIFIVMLAAGSVAAAIKRQECRIVFMWIQIIACLLMFISTQTHGQQHLMLYIPSLFMIMLILVRHITKEWMLIAMTVLSVANAVNVYIPRTQPHNIQEITHLALIPDFSMLPMHRDDTEEILALKQKLDKTIIEGDKIGVVSSSFVLNEDVLRNVEPSLGVKPTRDDYIASVPQVDSRDRDLTPLYNVNYLLVATPPQTHLAEGSQTVITETVRSFEEGTDISAAYEEVEDFETVINGITVKLFYRVQAEKRSDITAFESRLYK